MREVASWNFIPPIVSGSPSMVWASLHLNESQLNVLWKVAKMGPKSLSQLSKSEYFLPQKLNYISANNDEVWTANLKQPLKYKRPFIFKVVESLERKGLVKTEFRTSTVKLKNGFMPVVKKLVMPTVAGLILYLQNSDLQNSFTECMGLERTEKEKEKIENRRLVPFVDFWDFIIKQTNGKAMENNKSNDPDKDVGGKKCFMALAKTIKDFSGIFRARFVVNPHKVKYNGYVKVPGSMILFEEWNAEVERERGQQIAELLKNPKLAILVGAYLAYLINKDIRNMSLVNTEDIPEALSQLDSEKEFMFFRPELAKQGSLFKDGRLKDYVPKYSNVNYFFTGLFIKNLLWIETEKKNQTVASGNDDYKIYFPDEQQCSKCR
jgi:hypothetical protein